MFGIYILKLPIRSGTEQLDFRVCIREYLGFGELFMCMKYQVIKNFEVFVWELKLFCFYAKHSDIATSFQYGR
jgi:hypothetical protein